MDKSTFKQLTNEYDILYLIYHRSKNQHRQQIWFKYLNMMIRNLRKILKLQIDINRIRTTTTTTTTKDKIDYKTNQIIQYSNKILKLMKSSYWNYNSILVLGQYITLGLGLIGSLSKITHLIINGINGVQKRGINRDSFINKMNNDRQRVDGVDVVGSKDLKSNNEDEIDFGEVIPYEEEVEKVSINDEVKNNCKINKSNTLQFQGKENLQRFDKIDDDTDIQQIKNDDDKFHSKKSKRNLSSLSEEEEEEEEDSNIIFKKSKSKSKSTTIHNQSNIHSEQISINDENNNKSTSTSTSTDTKKRKLINTDTIDDIFESSKTKTKTKTKTFDNKKLKKKDTTTKPLKKIKKKKKSAIDDIFG
ncbi:hypothetical protein FOB64_003312 [Candida albicans]|uniref:RNase MRP protein 1 RNA binding domain-containing protein n=1 Tax=Candida albicans TaxID=5476 RepID=A0A8H6F3H9_CANAX|nr:hypothetical protein FOB64_003312 [Candida albicans]